LDVFIIYGTEDKKKPAERHEAAILGKNSMGLKKKGDELRLAPLLEAIRSVETLISP
jgi:hypothetical protein